MDFQSEPWDISAETDNLNQNLFSSSLIPTNTKKEKKVKRRKGSVRLAGNHEESTGIHGSTEISKEKKMGRKRKFEFVNSDDNSKRKKIRVQSVNSESKPENKESDSKPNAHQSKKKKKNTKNKNKFKSENCVTRQPGGKNLQRREIKEKPTVIREPANAIRNKEPTKETPAKLVGSNTGASKTGGKKSKHLKKMMSNDEVNRSGVSIKMDKNGENSGVTDENLSKVSKKKRKKNKTKTDANSAEKLDVKPKNTPNTESNKNLNGRVRKPTFNPAILSKMLAPASESKITDSPMENKIESRKKKKRKEMKVNEGGDIEKARKKTKNHKEIEFEEEVEVEEARKKKRKQKEIKVAEEAHLEKAPSKSLSLKERLMEQLNSARFRYINEQLYTQTGQEAQEMFEEDEEAFQVYHQGFQTQVNKWPANPVDLFIMDIKQLPGNKVVADFGCGDAKIARNVPHKVHSFDLVALNDHVTACDMAHVPLGNGSVDVAVFCLSLMGTNLADYLTEAHRVLKTGGQLKIAEVASRFHSLPQFLLKVEQFGFYQMSKDTSNKMFYIFTFKKTGKPKAKAPVLTLEPCVYKKR